MALAAKGRAAETDHRLRAWSAWQTASLTAFAYHSPKKMPKLESLTGQKPAPRIQTPDQMKSMFAAMRAKAARRQTEA